MREMSAQQIHEHINSSAITPFLLDVREGWEYDICHIEGSTLIPMNTIPNQLDKLNPEQETIVICHHGIRSRMVGRYLEQAKFRSITNLSGGVAAWAQTVDQTMPTY